MKVTEQIDALMTLAVDPVRFLVVPRLLAALLVLPMLTIWANAVGIAGGFLIGTLKLGILPSLYWKMSTAPLAFKDLSSGLLKSCIFAVVICIVSCFEGFRTEGGAEGVGRSTTTAVVSSFILIIAADCFLTALFYFVWR
jgi:phospholipid/cholesterol/gamma-HCH transport system permease protein